MLGLGIALGSAASPLTRIETATSSEMVIQNYTTTALESITSYVTSLPSAGAILTVSEYVTNYEQQTNFVASTSIHPQLTRVMKESLASASLEVQSPSHWRIPPAYSLLLR